MENEIMLLAGINECNVKWTKPGSEGQRSHGFPRNVEADLNILKYNFQSGKWL
jgi:hypothetical protein